MYFNGQGVDQSLEEAYAWMSIAAAQGKDVAIEQRNIIKSRMTAAQLDSGEALFTKLYQEILL